MPSPYLTTDDTMKRLEALQYALTSLSMQKSNPSDETLIKRAEVIYHYLHEGAVPEHVPAYTGR